MRRLFKFSMYLAVVFFLGMIGCSILLHYNTATLWSFDLVSMSTICLWISISLFVLVIVFAIAYKIKEATALFKKFR